MTKTKGTIFLKEMAERYQEIGRICINGRGDEKAVFTNKDREFPDKKETVINPPEFEKAVQDVARLKEGASVGQKEATWTPEMEYPKKPMTMVFLTDLHYLSTRIDYEIANKILKTVEETPNMYLVTGGDDCDNFNVSLGKLATGVYEDPFESGLQARVWRQKISELDKKGKVGFMVFGNHTDWSFIGGVDWYDTFLGGIRCPILTTGGLVHLNVGTEKYDIAATHKYWGTSKLNPSNAVKRFLDFEYPDADVILLGHTHQSENLMFEKGGKDRIGIIGGTLKLYEDYARKHGIGGRSGFPGNCVTFWPDLKRMTSYKNFDIAVEDHLNRLIN